MHTEARSISAWLHRSWVLGAALALSACTNPGDTSCDSSIDSDEDGLDDCRELELGTHPEVADTDGDGFLDKDEVENWDRFGPFHLRFNPLVADVPRVYMQQLGPPRIEIIARVDESTEVRYGMSDLLEDEVIRTTARGGQTARVVEEQHTVEVNAEVRTNGAVAVGTLSAGYQYDHTDTTTNSTFWNDQTVSRNRQEATSYYDAARRRQVTPVGGSIKVTMGLMNDGDVSYTLRALDLTALMVDPRNPSLTDPVGTLQYAGDLSFTPAPLGRDTTPEVSDLTPFVFEYLTENPDEISRVLQSSNRLLLQPGSFEIQGDQPDVNLELAADDVRARTAEILIDYGDVLPTQRHRVAVDTGGNETVSLAEVLEQRLDLDYRFGEGQWGERTLLGGLAALDGVEASESTQSYWMAAHTQGNRDSTVHHPLREAWSADDVQIRRGDVVHLMYVTDGDLDGLSDRSEVQAYTDPASPDTDGDGLNDAEEVFGWLTDLSASDCLDGPQVRVFSRPTLADSDGDGIDDGDERIACTNPMGDLAVDAGPDFVMVGQDDALTLIAVPRNAVDAASLRFTWTQLSGPDVGPLPATRRLELPPLGEVATLAFEVMVTDEAQNDLVATDVVRFVVVADADNALFVDLDEGRDSQPGSLEEPLRTLEHALSEANRQGADVYLRTPSGGVPYQTPATIELQDGVDLFGGYHGDWERAPLLQQTPIQVHAPTALIPAPERTTSLTLSGVDLRACGPLVVDSVECALLDATAHSSGIDVAGLGRVVLDRMSARGGDLRSGAGPTFDAGSSYGMRAIDVALVDVSGTTLAGGVPSDGGDGSVGAPGTPGNPGAPGSGLTAGPGGAGGPGGDGGSGGAGKATGCVAGNRGSGGGNAGGTGGAGGSGGAKPSGTFCDTSQGSSNNGGSGNPGANGASGAAQSASTDFPVGTAPAFRAGRGTAGASGTAGGGGGGGGGGASFASVVANEDGRAGGGGGEGGSGGGAGGAGSGGGGSFGLVLHNSDADIRDSHLATQRGGAGGSGGLGGSAGAGAAGGRGEKAGRSDGADGGRGGNGGSGGSGGGGAGGPTAGLVLLGGSSADVEDTSIATETAGSGRGPVPGQGGWNHCVYIAPGASLLTFLPRDCTLGGAGAGGPEASATNQ